MGTTTAHRKPTRSASLHEATAQLDSARAERARLEERRDNYAAELRQAQAEFDLLVAYRPDEFDDHGAAAQEHARGEAAPAARPGGQVQMAERDRGRRRTCRRDKRDQADPGWATATVEDGAALIFGTLGE